MTKAHMPTAASQSGVHKTFITQRSVTWRRKCANRANKDGKVVCMDQLLPLPKRYHFSITETASGLGD
jgi:hypothetical protein